MLIRNSGGAELGRSGVFAIANKPVVPKCITVSVPNRESVWEATSTHNIKWSIKGDFGTQTLKIDYSTDGKVSWKRVEGANELDPKLGVLPWEVPDFVKDRVRMRVQDLSTDAGDESDYYFGILPPLPEISVEYPNGGERLAVGYTYPIKWKSKGAVPSVKIEYCMFIGPHLEIEWRTPAIAQSIPNTGSYSWKVPDDIGKGFRIRVTHALNAAVTDMSNTGFEITRETPQIKVISPNGANDAWVVGTKRKIRWSPGNETAIPQVQILLTRTGNLSDAKKIHTETTVPHTGEYMWTVTGPASETCVVLVKAPGGVPADTSDAPFRILADFAVEKPNGGKYGIGKTCQIAWTPRDVPKKVRIEIQRDGGAWTALDPKNTTFPNTGNLSWKVIGPPAAACYIRVSDAKDGQPSGQNAKPFAIVPSITVTPPSGGETVRVGTTEQIKWHTGGAVAKVDIDLSRNNGTTWKRLKAGLLNTGSWPWPVQGMASKNCLIRVSDTDNDPADVSDAVFTIAASTTGTTGAITTQVGTVEPELTLPPEDAAPGAHQITEEPQAPWYPEGTMYVRGEEGGMTDHLWQLDPQEGLWDTSIPLPDGEAAIEPEPTPDGGGTTEPTPDRPGTTPGTEIVYYLYSFDNKLLAEYSADGICTRDYIYAGNRLVAEWRTIDQQLHFYTPDQINSTRLITDASGNEKYQATFDPYGGIQKQSGDYDPALKFSGKERDSTTSLDYFGARWYANQQRRWVSVDPVMNRDAAIANPQMWNLYAYCNNNPVTLLDPDGRSIYGTVIMVVKGGFKTIGRNQGKEALVRAVNEGEDVLAKSRRGALQIAKEAGGGKRPILDKAHGPKEEGFRDHYHTADRSGGHVFFSLTGLAAILAPTAMAMSAMAENDDEITTTDVALSGAWDVAQAIDPVFLTDLLSWFAGIEYDEDDTPSDNSAK